MTSSNTLILYSNMDGVLGDHSDARKPDFLAHLEIAQPLSQYAFLISLNPLMMHRKPCHQY